MMEMERVKLGDISKLINGDRGKNYPSQADITDDGEIPFINAGHLNGGSIDFSEMNYISQDKYDKLNSGKFQKGDILYCLRGSLGKKAIVNNDINGAIASSLVIIRPDPEKVSGEYLMLALDSPAIKKQLVKANNGSSQPNLSAASVREYEVELPEFSIQKEVVEKLIKVRSIIDNRRQELQLLNDLIKARFVEMFGDNDKKIAISSLCDVSGGYSFKSEDISSTGFIKILQIGNVYLDDVNWETTNYLPKGFDNVYSRFLLNEGDIVIALTRPIIQSLGNVKACIVKVSDTPCLLNQRVGRIVSKKNVDVNLKFIYGCLMTDDFTRYVESCCIGCSQPNISTKDIENYMIPDASYEKQMDFVKFKEQVDKSKVVVQKALDETQILFNSLMQQYFG